MSRSIFFSGSRRLPYFLCAVNCLTVAMLVGPAPPVRAAVRIKDLTTVEGVRTNQLTGLGLVTGLAGTGATDPATRLAASNMLQRFGLRLSPTARLSVIDDTKMRTNNMSVVTVTANLPIFAREGSQIDVRVAAWGDTKSLKGGDLMATPLTGADGHVYAVASGPISVGGGFSFDGNAASTTKNHPTTGRIANGANVEKRVPHRLGEFGQFRLLLRSTDFVNAHRVAQSINRAYPGVATSIDGSTIRVLVPLEHMSNPVAYVSAVRSLLIEPDVVAKVVINERTGTVVVGENVRISPVAITHANLAIMTSETPEVSQPAPLSDGVTAVVPRTQLDVVEERRPMHMIDRTTTVSDLASALNALGVTPRDLSSIFQQLKTAGALHAELEFQ